MFSSQRTDRMILFSSTSMTSVMSAANQQYPNNEKFSLKKVKFRGIFRDKFVEKSAHFEGIFRANCRFCGYFKAFALIRPAFLTLL